MRIIFIPECNSAVLKEQRPLQPHFCTFPASIFVVSPAENHHKCVFVFATLLSFMCSTMSKSQRPKHIDYFIT